MAASNINSVVITGNLTKDPELRSTPERDLRLQAPSGRQQPPQGRPERRVGRQAQLLRRHRLGRAGRELRQLPLQGTPGRRRGPPRLARMGGPGRRQAPGGRDHRRQRPVPRLALDNAGGRRWQRLPGAVGRPGRHLGLRGRRSRARAAARTTTSRSSAAGPSAAPRAEPATPATARQSVAATIRAPHGATATTADARPAAAAGAAVSPIADGRASTRGSTSSRSTTRT